MATPSSPSDNAMSSNPPHSVKAAKLSASSHLRLPMPNLDQLLDDTSGRVSWNEILAILAHQSSTSVMREKPSRSDATPALAKCEFDISTLVTMTREPPQVSRSLLEMTMPDQGYRIGTRGRIGIFDTRKASLHQHVQNTADWLGTVLLEWVGLKPPRFRIMVIPEILNGGERTLLCTLIERDVPSSALGIVDDSEGRTETNIGSIVVESPFITEGCRSRSTDGGIESAKRTDIDIRGRPFFKDDLQPRFKGLLISANTCLDTPIDAEPDIIIDPARWLRFYESLFDFLILGMTQHSLKFRNCLEAKFMEIALHNDFARFLEEAEEFFASGTIDPYPPPLFLGISSTHAPRYLHLELHPGQLLFGSEALIFIYEGQGIVVKTFTDPKQYQNELSVYSVFSGQQGFPTLLAHGRSPPFILITYGGVSPPELSPVQL
ncbi:hypothetical protein H1R20_g8823, partial [Candolleomyces eurysporus]